MIFLMIERERDQVPVVAPDVTVPRTFRAIIKLFNSTFNINLL